MKILHIYRILGAALLMLIMLCGCQDTITPSSDVQDEPEHVHTRMIDPGVAPSCTKAGISDGIYCADCHEILVPQTSLARLGHTYRENVCTRCGYTYSVGLQYRSNGDGSCAVAGMGECTDTDIRIPDVAPSGEAVTGIDPKAFYESKLTAVTIPGSVLSIGDHAFAYCHNLQQLTLEQGVRLLDSYAFYNCSALPYVVLPDTLQQVGMMAFANCRSLTQLTFPDSVTTLGDGALSYCTALREVMLPEHISLLPSRFFLCCYALTTLTIPNSVVTIGAECFRNCRMISAITIPPSVIEIMPNAFESCAMLTRIAFDDGEDWFVLDSVGNQMYPSRPEGMDLSRPDTNATMLRKSSYRNHIWKKVRIIY